MILHLRTRTDRLCNAVNFCPVPKPEDVPDSEVTDAERKALQIRRALVARRRELLSELSVRKEKEEASRRAEFFRKHQEEEARKAAQDLRNKEVERARREIENIRVEEAKKLAQSLKEKGTLKVDITVRRLSYS